MQIPRNGHTHHSWLRFSNQLAPHEAGRPLILTNTAFSLVHIVRGDVRARWICRGREFNADGAAGAVRFNPADDEKHVLVGTAGEHGMRWLALIIPPNDIHTMASVDGIARLPELRMNVWPNDTVLKKCLGVLAQADLSDDADVMGDQDDAARLLVLRLAELMNAERPDWYCDECRFSKRTLDDLVLYIDAHLRGSPTASEMASLCGLSPSHFAKKFRHSTGHSLHRFINRRRLQASLELLKDQSRPLAHVALELGFSSQSHFTRLFSEMTGMTPAKYRRQFRRTVGGLGWPPHPTPLPDCHAAP